MTAWWTFEVAAEFPTDKMAEEFADALADTTITWGAEHRVDVHVSGSKTRPDWLEEAPSCQIPDCHFPAEWAVQVYVNGSAQDYLCCGAHREEVAAAASSSVEVAWGDAELSVREL